MRAKVGGKGGDDDDDDDDALCCMAHEENYIPAPFFYHPLEDVLFGERGGVHIVCIDIIPDSFSCWDVFVGHLVIRI